MTVANAAADPALYRKRPTISISRSASLETSCAVAFIRATCVASDKTDEETSCAAPDCDCDWAVTALSESRTFAVDESTSAAAPEFCLIIAENRS